MVKRLIILLVCLIPCFQYAQDYSTNWKGYFSYYEIREVIKGENKIYGASQNAIFTYDIQTKEYGEITTVNGLSGESITTIVYNSDFGLLLIGYENGLIEIVFDEDEEVLSVVDILEKSVIPDDKKRINHFNTFENVVYVSTNYGISVFSLERLEFGDTFFIGDAGEQIKVNQTAVFEGNLYAACEDGGGIRKAELSNPNLIDYRSWQTITTGDFSSIQSTRTNLYASATNRKIFNLSNDILSELFTYNDSPVIAKFVDDKLLIQTPKDIFVYDSSFNLVSQVSGLTDYPTSFSSVTIDSEDLYVGTKDFGVMKRLLSNETVFEELHPSCPLLNRVFSVTAQSNNLWVTYGEHTLLLNPYPLNNRGFSYFIDNEWVNIPYEDVFEAKCLKEININPFNTNQVFIGSYFSGLLEINEGVPTILYNQTNSGLKSLIFPSNPNYVDIRVSATNFDDNGLLWTLTNFTEKPLKSFNPSNSRWESYDLNEIIASPGDNGGFNDLVIDNNQTKWMGTSNKGVIAFNENGGNKLIKNLVSEEDNIPSVRIMSLALDKREQLWIGTNIGLRVLYGTSNFFTDETIKAEEIIIEEDGVAKELLFEQFISDIVVDGSNNKWISTAGAGLFYLSSDGQKTIFHFTKTNSALPSDNIIKLSLDESTGILYIATENGLVSFSSGSSSTSEDLNTAYVYPNPVRPSFNIVDDKIKIKGISENVNIKITDIAGNLVAEAQSNTNQRYSGYNLEIDGGVAFWNGKNLANNIVASGVYLVMLSDLDSFETKVLKLMVVR